MKVVVQAEATPQDVLKHIQKQDKKENVIKEVRTGEDHSSAEKESRSDSERGGVSPSVPPTLPRVVFIVFVGPATFAASGASSGEDPNHHAPAGRAC